MDGTLKVLINNTIVDIDLEKNDPSTTYLRKIDNKVVIKAKSKLTLRYGKMRVTLYPNGLAVFQEIKG